MPCTLLTNSGLPSDELVERWQNSFLFLVLTYSPPLLLFIHLLSNFGNERSADFWKSCSFQIPVFPLQKTLLQYVLSFH
ncbi:unnamed protein product [Hymenolepis diminuta]|uniref:Uncharacterized protein n=1 Tax=Hymenolepis diminuta TaxID=6216 RepID=A0A564YEI7_HYMDI|nr:unnamed protein product [Hymenolepis diminuta]